jgi:gamma-glutamyltranspeptidase/glutathione hydrolase
MDAPRWRILKNMEVIFESGFEPEVLEDLGNRGHRIESAAEGSFGGGQLIYRLADGYYGASDPRKDGQAVGV